MEYLKGFLKAMMMIVLPVLFIIGMILLFSVTISEAKGALLENPVYESAGFSSEYILEPGGMIYIMNLKGEIFAYCPTGRTSQEVVFDISGYPSGAYCFVVSNSEGVQDSAVFVKL